MKSVRKYKIRQQKTKTSRRVVVAFGLFLVLLLIFVLSRLEQAQPRLPDAVTRWEEEIVLQMDRQGLSRDWLDTLMAQMMQESSGLRVDLFQCSESKYGVPGLIQSEYESIEQAVYYWTLLIARANEIGVSPSQENLLQSYNMGIGYLDYLKHFSSDTTVELASDFSRDWLEGGGDVYYVQHVQRYLEWDY